MFRMGEIQLRRMPSLLRGLGVRSRDGYTHEDHCPVHHRFSRSDDRDVTQPHQRFIRIHPSDFPLARLPLSARSFLGRYPSLSTPLLPVSAVRDWEQALDTRLKASASLNSCDLVSH